MSSFRQPKPQGFSFDTRIGGNARVNTVLNANVVNLNMASNAAISVSETELVDPELVDLAADLQLGLREDALHKAVTRLICYADLGLDRTDLRLLESVDQHVFRYELEKARALLEIRHDLSAADRCDTEPSPARSELEPVVARRLEHTNTAYIVLLTDGVEWRSYILSHGVWSLASVCSLAGLPKAAAATSITEWLDGLFACTDRGKATSAEIRLRLGASSSSHQLEKAQLSAIYTIERSQSEVSVKRDLWARLLTTALGAQFKGDDDLFIEHTLLVATASIIAHAVLKVDPVAVTAKDLLSGRAFSEAEVTGVVDADFFSWIADSHAGRLFVEAMARRISRFDWSDVSSDVMKTLYESVIPVETRKQLGEYYTPDWLAEAMVNSVIGDPIHERVLDPACGSGTFLFYAVRRFLTEAEKTMSVADALEALPNYVIGVDLHPVAVALARVTYLLAIGTERLDGNKSGRRSVHVPVYLGDSIQWRQRADLFTSGRLIVSTEDAEFVGRELIFPAALVEDPRKFDALVAELARLATDRAPGARPTPSLQPVFRRHGLRSADRDMITETFHTMCDLHDHHRDGIWGYYVRNLARPIWLEHMKVDIVLGNPPWLPYNGMTDEMQKRFREMCETRGLWAGGSVATNQDLAALFIARVLQLYLREGGKFAFVTSNAVLSRRQYAGFRTGDYFDLHAGSVRVQFAQSWDLAQIRPHFFPRAAAVISGSLGSPPVPMESKCRQLQGRLPNRNASWSEVSLLVSESQDVVEVADSGQESVYAGRFSNGANVYPVPLVRVVKAGSSNSLGRSNKAIEVVSARSNYGNEPWKSLEPLRAVVDQRFIRDLLLGEHVLPFCLRPSLAAVIPWDGERMLTNEEALAEPGLSTWWMQADRLWRQHRRSRQRDVTLVGALNHHNKLADQFQAAGTRIAYTKSGMHLAAARVSSDAVIENTLYWATVSGNDEALFLLAVLNSEIVTTRLRPLQSVGKDPRHYDKAVWRLGIPEFDPKNQRHSAICALGAAAEDFVDQLNIPVDMHFVTARRLIRNALVGSELMSKLNFAIQDLLDHPFDY